MGWLLGGYGVATGSIGGGYDIITKADGIGSTGHGTCVSKSARR
jgi:hypothetical protein